MGRAKPRPTTKLLIAVDDELLSQFDHFWRATGYPSRTAGVRAALQLAVSTRAAYVQQQASPAGGPSDGGGWIQGPADSADTVAQAVSRPLTADLKPGG